MNMEQTKFLKSLSVKELLQLLNDIHYASGEVVTLVTEEFQNRQWNYTRACKLGLAVEKGAGVAAELLWRCYYD